MTSTHRRLDRVEAAAAAKVAAEPEFLTWAEIAEVIEGHFTVRNLRLLDAATNDIHVHVPSLTGESLEDAQQIAAFLAEQFATMPPALFVPVRPESITATIGALHAGLIVYWPLPADSHGNQQMGMFCNAPGRLSDWSGAHAMGPTEKALTRWCAIRGQPYPRSQQEAIEALGAILEAAQNDEIILLWEGNGS